MAIIKGHGSSSAARLGNGALVGYVPAKKTALCWAYHKSAVQH